MNRRASPLGVTLSALCVSLCACAPSRDEVFAALETVPRGDELEAVVARLGEHGDEETRLYIQEALTERPLVVFDAATATLAQYVDADGRLWHVGFAPRHRGAMKPNVAVEDVVDVHLARLDGDAVFIIEVRDSDLHYGLHRQTEGGQLRSWMWIELTAQQLDAALALAAADPGAEPGATPSIPSGESLPGTWYGLSWDAANAPVPLTLEPDGRYVFDFEGCEVPGIKESGRWKEIPWGLAFDAEQANHHGRDILNPPSGRLRSRVDTTVPMLTAAYWARFEDEWLLVPDYLPLPLPLDRYQAPACLTSMDARVRLGWELPPEQR